MPRIKSKQPLQFIPIQSKILKSKSAKSVPLSHYLLRGVATLRSEIRQTVAEVWRV